MIPFLPQYALRFFSLEGLPKLLSALTGTQDIPSTHSCTENNEDVAVYFFLDCDGTILKTGPRELLRHIIDHNIPLDKEGAKLYIEKHKEFFIKNLKKVMQMKFYEEKNRLGKNYSPKCIVNMGKKCGLLYHQDLFVGG